MELSATQKYIFDQYKNGKNIFITGPGGCGKSFLIQKIYKDALENQRNIAVTALTGCAAILLQCNAKTIHSWASIKNGTLPAYRLINFINKKKKFRDNWTKTDILVVDEVSMMSKQLFELLDDIGRGVRNNIDHPFGGIQIIFSGDFFQLPPIGNKDDIDSSKFCFESDKWNDIFDEEILLSKSYRQTNLKYVKILNQIRQGSISKKSINILNQRILNYTDTNTDTHTHTHTHTDTGTHTHTHTDTDTQKTIPIKLMSNKLSVNNINITELNKLQTPLHKFKYTSKYTEPIKKSIRYKKPTKKEFDIEEEYLLKNLIIEKELYMKIGSQVMSVVNYTDQPICNGSMGKIIDFTPGGHPKVLFDNGLKRTIKPVSFESDNIKGFYILQYPLILSWAITIHKSQGQTLEKAEMELGSNIFASGQTYVALSRIKSLDGLYLKSFDPNKIIASKKVIEYYKSFS